MKIGFAIGQAADHFEQARTQLLLNALQVGFGLNRLPDFLLRLILTPCFVQLILQERCDRRAGLGFLQNLECIGWRKILR